MSSSGRRILNWISTGNHIFDSDYEKKQSGSIEAATDVSSFEHIVEISPNGSLNDEFSEDLSSQPESTKMLVGCDNDLLIPRTEQINSTFLKCQNLWLIYIAQADLLPSGRIPVVSLEAYNLLQDVPPIPQNLHKKQIITGRALWHVPSPEFHDSDDETWNANPTIYHTVIMRKSKQPEILGLQRSATRTAVSTKIMAWVFSFCNTARGIMWYC